MRPASANTSIRTPAVAGLFYPGEAERLRATVSAHLRQAHVVDLPSPALGLIVPHAGYPYSGSIAAAAYATIAARSGGIRRVVLIGPSHRVWFEGMALPGADAFATPLGAVTVDPELRATLLDRDDVIESDAPHELEHCLEVQLPFLQMLLDDFTLLPLVLGAVSPQQVASVLGKAWHDARTLVLVSSDLSHYHDYETARRIDAATSSAIVRHDFTLSGDQACGAAGINGLLYLARQRGFAVTEIARCNSGDTAADKSRVVGYGAFAVHETRRSPAS